MSLRAGFSRFALAGILSAVAFGGAWAQDAGTVAEHLKAALAVQGMNIAWTGVTGDSSRMVLQGVTLSAPGAPESLPIGDLTLSGVTEEEGGFHIDNLVSAPASHEQDSMTFDIGTIEIDSLHIPTENATAALDKIAHYESLKLDTASVKVGTDTAFSMNGLAVQMSPLIEGKVIEMTTTLGGFNANLGLVDDPKTKATLEELGYSEISGNFDAAGTWNPASGEAVLSKYDLTVDKAGTFGSRLTLGGYTLDFLNSLQALSKEIPADDNKALDLHSRGVEQMSHLLGSLSLVNASIRFEDDSLTGRLLDYFAKQQGVSAKDLANQAKAMVPFLMAQLNNPELAAQVSAALNTYLDDPRSIEISAAPASPMTFEQIMTEAKSNPLDLPNTIRLKVSANQP